MKAQVYTLTIRLNGNSGTINTWDAIKRALRLVAGSKYLQIHTIDKPLYDDLSGTKISMSFETYDV